MLEPLFDYVIETTESQNVTDADLLRSWKNARGSIGVKANTGGVVINFMGIQNVYGVWCEWTGIEYTHMKPEMQEQKKLLPQDKEDKIMVAQWYKFRYFWANNDRYDLVLKEEFKHEPTNNIEVRGYLPNERVGNVYL